MHWVIIDKNISLMSKSFVKHGHILKEINKTYFTSVPKRITCILFHIIDLLVRVMYSRKS